MSSTDLDPLGWDARRPSRDWSRDRTHGHLRDEEAGHRDGHHHDGRQDGYGRESWPRQDRAWQGGWSRDSHDASPFRSHGPSFLARGEAWLDQRGKGAWIAAMVLGFILFWPVGLGLLAYMIWSKRMFSKSCGHGRANRHDAFRAARAAVRPSGNSAFDSYKAETLRRLEDEQSAFEEFLGRLRAAKDKAEFDQFMDDRAQNRATPRAEDSDAGDEMPEPRR